MTKPAVDALRLVRDQLEEVIGTLSDDEWVRPSACAGWRVRDVVAHLGASARGMVEPDSLVHGPLPLPEQRERQHDVHVDLRRNVPLGEVLDEYRTYGGRAVEVVATLQDEPLASNTVPVPGLGEYPLHSIANALTFDHYCHLRHDILAPGGPISRDLPAAEQSTVYAAVQWMMLGLPQMQGPELSDALRTPITIRLTGPGAGTWTVSRPDPDGRLVVTEDDTGRAGVTSDAGAFVAWGTKRRDWRQDATVDGDVTLVTPFLDRLNVI